MADENTPPEPLSEINSYLLAIAGGLATTLEEIEKSNLSDLEKLKAGIRAISSYLAANNDKIATFYIDQASILYPNGRNVTLIESFSIRIEQGAARLLQILDAIDQNFVDGAIDTASRFKSIGTLE